MNPPADPYQQFIDEGAVVSSEMTAYLPPWTGRPDLDELRERLRGHPRITSVSEVRAPMDDDFGAIGFVWGEGGSALDFQVVLLESLTDFDATLPLSPEESEQAERSEWCFTLATYFGDEVLNDFHSQLRVLDLVAPEALLVYDYGSFRFHSGRWLRETARSKIPPPPDTLYAVHAVTNRDGDLAWLHSHGLHRCGCIELEMLDVPQDDLSIYGNLFNVTAALFIERGTPPPREPFEAGHELVLHWVPWEDAIAGDAPDETGREDDRDEYHDHASGVLFAHVEAASTADLPAPITAYQEILEDEPVMFHTQMETQRMSLLAKDRFPRLRAMLRRFPTNDEWMYHVKLGYQVDDCPDDEDDNEHLWFDVHEIRGSEMVATLLNEPYHIARMHAGDRAHHPVDQLSDWTIDCPHGVFDPSSIGQLEELVDRS